MIPPTFQFERRLSKANSKTKNSSPEPISDQTLASAGMREFVGQPMIVFALHGSVIPQTTNVLH